MSQSCQPVGAPSSPTDTHVPECVQEIVQGTKHAVEEVAEDIEEGLDKIKQVVSGKKDSEHIHHIHTDCCGVLERTQSQMSDMLALKPHPACFTSVNGQVRHYLKYTLYPKLVRGSCSQASFDAIYYSP